MLQLIWCWGINTVTMLCQFCTASIACQFSSKLFSRSLSLCGSVSTVLLRYISGALHPNGKCLHSQVIHSGGLHQLEASSYQEYRHQLASRVVLSVDLQCRTACYQLCVMSLSGNTFKQKLKTHLFGNNKHHLVLL